MQDLGAVDRVEPAEHAADQLEAGERAGPEDRGHEPVDEGRRQVGAVAAEAEHVAVVVLPRGAGLLRGEAKGGAHAPHLVGRHGSARPAPAEEHGRVGSAIRDGPNGGLAHVHPLTFVAVGQRADQRDVVFPPGKPLDDRISDGLSQV